MAGDLLGVRLGVCVFTCACVYALKRVVRWQTWVLFPNEI